METKSKKKVFNIVMVLLILVIIGCGIMAVGNIKGWFGGNSESPVVTDEIVGVANVERSGVAYSLTDKTPVKAGDILETETGSQAGFKIKGGSFLSMGEKASMTAESCEEDSVAMTVGEGELYGEADVSAGELQISGSVAQIIPEDAILSISVHKGSEEISIFKGSASVKINGSEDETLVVGEKLLISGGDKTEVDRGKLKASELSDFQIEKLIASNDKDACFTKDKLEKVTAERQKEVKAAEEALEQEAIVVAENKGEQGENAAAAQGKDVMTCTIQIQCKSILGNMGKLAAGKNRYVPSNGVILATSKVEFNKGDTAYDVTKRACSAAGIQIEAAYTPAYGSYYVEGINHLYEFDCGETSGWKYKVNGWAPNYGCSEYDLKNGDSIVWYYTCNGN